MIVFGLLSLQYCLHYIIFTMWDLDYLHNMGFLLLLLYGTWLSSIWDHNSLCYGTLVNSLLTHWILRPRRKITTTIITKPSQTQTKLLVKLKMPLLLALWPTVNNRSMLNIRPTSNVTSSAVHFQKALAF